MDLRFTLVGLIIGFLIGLTGMGGGSLMTPVMILVLGVKPLVAVGTDLAYGAVTRMVGGAQHVRQGTVHRRTAYLLAAGSAPSAVLGVGVINRVKQTHPALVSGFVVHAVACALILVAVVLVAKPLITRRLTRAGRREDILALGERAPWALPPIGAGVGFLVGLTSVGAGTLIVLALIFLYPRWESKDLVGTDVFHAALLVGAAGIAQFAAGNVNVPMMLSLLLGSIPGVLVGSRLAVGFPEQMLRLSMASILLVTGAKLL